MDSYCLDSNRSPGHDFSKPCQLLSHSLVLDSEKGELVETAARSERKSASEAKTVAALKNHSEAEKRRRERINGHLTTLRGLVPCREKMDKATLLAEVITQVKELKRKALEASEGLLIPTDDDEVRVEPHNDVTGNGRSYFRASLCCEYRPELLSDLNRALDALDLDIMKAEISTLGCRVRNVLVFTSCKGETPEGNKILVHSVLQALSSVMEKGSGLGEFSPRTTGPNKRSRVSFFDSLSASS